MQRGSSFCRVSSIKASCTQSSGESVHWAAKSTSAPPCSSSRRLRASGVSSGLTRFLPPQHHYDGKRVRFSQGEGKKWGFRTGGWELGESPFSSYLPEP